MQRMLCLHFSCFYFLVYSAILLNNNLLTGALPSGIGALSLVKYGNNHYPVDCSCVCWSSNGVLRSNIGKSLFCRLQRHQIAFSRVKSVLEHSSE